MIQNITLVLCLESINMWIDMDNKIIEKIQNLLELSIKQIYCLLIR